MRRNRAVPGAAGAVLAAMLMPAPVASAAASGDGFDQFDAGNFTTSSGEVTNPYLPLVPGTQDVFEGTVKEDGEVRKHTVILTVTDLVKKVDGVTTRVIWDRDFDDGVLGEEELAFQAQDADGAVWLVGEYPEVNEDGKFVGAPDTWISGTAKATAGVLMLASPTVGTAAYRQGFAPDIEFDDRGQVVKTGQRTCDAITCYDDVIVIKESNHADPTDGFQLKYHAPGVGVVRVEALSGDAQETLLLTKHVQLGADELAAAGEHVKAMDKRAYKVAAGKYGATSPVEQPAPAPAPAAPAPAAADPTRRAAARSA